MALFATQQAVTSGLTPSYSAVSASDTAVPGDNVMVHVKNGGGSPDTVTLVNPTTVDGVALVNGGKQVTVPAGAERMISLPATYQNPSTGLVTIQHSFTTSVTAAVIGV